MTVLLGIPELSLCHPGIDVIGRGCRVDSSVSVMRFGSAEPNDRIVLADGVSLYGQTRLVLSDVDASASAVIRIGAGTIVNVGCYLSGEGGLTIGADVLIGPHVKILSGGHDLDGPDGCIARNRITRHAIVIQDGAWIGAGATVLEGVTVGRGGVVAAGAVVTSDVPDFGVVAGVPARLVRMRSAGLPGGSDMGQRRSWARAFIGLWRRIGQWH